ncbi:hypothetical protein Trydic_g23351 [Trypoxylus dichotomus]
MFSGKIVLITGASSGIGAATAVHFAEEGAKLALTARNKANLEETAKKCREKNDLEALVIPADLKRDSDVQNIIDSTVKTYGRLDILVNNAALMKYVPLGTPSAIDAFDEVFDTNIRAVYLLTNLAIPYLIESKGNIVNISSTLALRTLNNASSYCMSKAALDHFTRCAALELTPKKVRVNGVNSGVINTPIHGSAGVTDLERFYETVTKHVPAGVVGRVDDVSRAVLFLASEQASFITGENLVVDGGFTIISPIPTDVWR